MSHVTLFPFLFAKIKDRDITFYLSSVIMVRTQALFINFLVAWLNLPSLNSIRFNFYIKEKEIIILYHAVKSFLTAKTLKSAFAPEQKLSLSFSADLQ